MSGSPLLQDYIRKDRIVELMQVEHVHGKDAGTAVAEGNLEALAAYLKGSLGAEAAFDVFTRHAEEIIRPAVNAGVRAP